MSDKTVDKEVKYKMPAGFECPICMKASMDLYGVTPMLNETHYYCISCNYMITIKKMLP